MEMIKSSEEYWGNLLGDHYESLEVTRSTDPQDPGRIKFKLNFDRWRTVDVTIKLLKEAILEIEKFKKLP